MHPRVSNLIGIPLPLLSHYISPVTVQYLVTLLHLGLTCML